MKFRTIGPSNSSFSPFVVPPITSAKAASRLSTDTCLLQLSALAVPASLSAQNSALATRLTDCA